ncbi:MAG: prepilin-type N-terminal cleavage/methylation domain-containing protein [Armatimonadota bacterium]
MKRAAFTLMELLVVIAIIVVLVGLLLPVISQVRRQAEKIPCMNNLKQIHAAMMLYLDDYNEYPLGMRFLLPYSRNNNIFLCPLDDKGGVATETKFYKFKTSYRIFGETYTVLSFVRALEKADPNHGLTCCTLHGEPRANPLGFDAHYSFDGRVLRLRKDGSVQFVNVPIRCFGPRDIPNVVHELVRYSWELMTDAPCPQVECPDYYREDLELRPCPKRS